MANRERKKKSDPEKDLADRLIERIERDESGSGSKRLGDRLSARREGYGGDEREKTVSSEEDHEVTDFFDEVTQLAEKYPELKDVKVSQLKKAISQTGMRHPEEVIDKLRKKEYRTKLRELEDEWITY